MEFVFSPIYNSSDLFGDFYKSGVNIDCAMLFRPGNKILIDLLSMFLSLEELSHYLQNGSYEFLSRIRIAYMNKIKGKTFFRDQTMIGGSEKNKIIQYEKGLSILYPIINQKNITKRRNSATRLTRRKTL